MSKRLMLLLMVSFVVVVTACECDQAVPTPPRPPTPTPMPTAEIVTLTFRNDSGVTVCVVFASPVASETYGDNILGNDLAEPGDSRTFELPVDTHALSVYDCDSNEPITEVGFDVYQPTEWRVDDTVLDDRSEPAASRWA